MRGKNLYHVHVSTRDTRQKHDEQADGQGFYCVPVEADTPEEVSEVAKDASSYPKDFKDAFPTEDFSDVEVLECDPADVMLMYKAALSKQFLRRNADQEGGDGLVLDLT